MGTYQTSPYTFEVGYKLKSQVAKWSFTQSSHRTVTRCSGQAVTVSRHRAHPVRGRTSFRIEPTIQRTKRASVKHQFHRPIAPVPSPHLLLPTKLRCCQIYPIQQISH